MTKLEALEACNEIHRIVRKFPNNMSVDQSTKIDDLSDKLHDFIQDNVEDEK